MGVERLFGDYTIDRFRELVKQEYTRETGREAKGKNFQLYTLNLLNEAVSKLYEEKVMASGRALSESNLFKNLFFKKKEPLNLIGKDVRKSDKKKDYLFMVKTIEDLPGLPEGSCIYIENDKLKKHYVGIWSSMAGSYSVKVPKDKCRKLDEL